MALVPWIAAALDPELVRSWDLAATAEVVTLRVAEAWLAARKEDKECPHIIPL
jgi:hypothetical protein